MVETFEVEEVASETVECSDEARELMEKLGLKGQQAIAGTSGQRQPYRRMTRDEWFVYKVLCPQDTQLRDYDGEPMPLRVLQVAAHASECGMFKELRVWSRESARIKDPVLVGVGSDKNDWNKPPYILARWGDMLDEMPALLRQAREIAAEKIRAAGRKIQAAGRKYEAEAEGGDLDELRDLATKTSEFIHF